jgi:ERCC4-type nuclease
VPKLSIIIDTREQRPWHFPEEAATTRRDTLTSGDYALEGDTWAIERKSLDDFVGTITTGWKRFQNELERMAALGPTLPPVVIVEGSMNDIIAHKYNHPVVRPKLVLSRIALLTLRGVHVILADNSVLAAVMAYELLKDRHEQLSPAA